MANNFVLTLPSPVMTVDLREGMAAGGMALPLPTLSCSIRSGTVFTMTGQGQGTMPWPMTLSAAFGGLNASPELPALTVGSITGTIPNLLRANPTLPALASAGITATLGGLASAAITLPLPTVAMTRGSMLAPVLPALTGTATISSNLSFSLNLTLPRLTGAAVLTNAETVLRADIILPALLGSSGHTAVAANLPALRGACTIVAGTAAVRQAWVMNVANLGMTQFTNFPFRAFARAYDTYYGVGLDSGMVQFGGDKDETAAIAWSFQTGISDLQSRARKGVLGLYLDGVAESGTDFGVLTDDGAYWYSHQPHGTPNNHKTQRVSVGRRLRSVNWGFAMRSAKGAYVEIDSITPEWQISDRNL